MSGQIDKHDVNRLMRIPAAAHEQPQFPAALTATVFVLVIVNLSFADLARAFGGNAAVLSFMSGVIVAQIVVHSVLIPLVDCSLLKRIAFGLLIGLILIIVRVAVRCDWRSGRILRINWGFSWLFWSRCFLLIVDATLRLSVGTIYSDPGSF